MKPKTITIIFAAVTIFFAMKANSAGAATYYVASSGNDANAGTSEAAPWKTIAKVNSSGYQPGDKILLKRGGIWREQLNNFSSGIAGNPITYGSYGEGEKPMISGADLVTGWTNHSGNVYVASINPAKIPDQLYIDGIYYDLAHYPNSGWLKATANAPNTTSVVDVNLNLAADQIVGASVVSRPVDWYISTTKATAYDSANHTIIVDKDIFSTYILKKDWGYYLQNKLWMLDSPGEWFYDPSEKKLYIWMPDGGSPEGHEVEISVRDFALRNCNGNFAVFENLAIENAYANNLVFACGNSDSIVNNLDSRGGKVGMMFYSTSNTVVSNNAVNGSVSAGISLDHENYDNEAFNNVIENVGMVGTMPKLSSSGLFVYKAGNKVWGNTIKNMAHDGIHFGGENHLIENNTIDGTCLLFDDCGGFYTGGGEDGSPSNTILKGNIVKNTIGNASGTAHTATAVNAIYLDEMANNITVINNTVFNADRGIFIHTGFNNTVTGNVCTGTRSVGFMLNHNHPYDAPDGTVHDNVVTNNIFEYIGTGATVNYWSRVLSGTSGFGKFDYNKYYHPNSEIVVSNEGISYTLSAWQQFSGQDLHSTDYKANYIATTYNNSDINSDSRVNVTDLGILMSDFGKTAANAANPWSDINSDGIVNVQDLGMMMSEWS